MSETASAAPLLVEGLVVHWRSPAALAQLLRDWPRDPRYGLIVVDNSGELERDGAIEPRPGLAILRPGRNLGFAGGVNRALEQARAPLVMLLNPDARPLAGAVEELAGALESHPSWAGTAPRLIGDDGAPQHEWQLRALPRPSGLLRQVFFLRGVPRTRAEPAAGTPVAQPAAAALLLRRSVLCELGGLDAAFYPAWFEDVDLAARLAAGGHALHYWPRATFVHGLGGSLEALGYGAFLWIYYRNLVRYLCKHHGTVWATAALVSIPAAALARALLVPLRRPRRARGRGDALRGLAGLAIGGATGFRAPGVLRRSFTAPQSTPAASLRPQTDDCPVDVCIVSFNSAADLEGCLEAVQALTHRPLALWIVDCASTDSSVEIARRFAARAAVPTTVVPLDRNLGFAGGMNEALARGRAPWALLLNPDARPEPDYLDRLLGAVEHASPSSAHGRGIGASTGRLLRPTSNGEPVLDACGMRLTLTWRHLDRASGRPDRGQLATRARVFGATGAASLFRRAALEDVAIGGRIFDDWFHSYREDAELCFRLQERGWDVLYEPQARATHRRHVAPGRRRELTPEINFHSLKNRYLLRLYHQTAANLVATLPFTLLRDAMALGYVLLRERDSLPAYSWLWRNRRALHQRRRAIQSRKTRSVDAWFLRTEAALRSSTSGATAATPSSPPRAESST